MKEFMAKAEEVMRTQGLMTDGFCRAFVDATGLDPQEAEMVVQKTVAIDPADQRHVWTEKIWFQRKTVGFGR